MNKSEKRNCKIIYINSEVVPANIECESVSQYKTANGSIYYLLFRKKNFIFEMNNKIVSTLRNSTSDSAIHYISDVSQKIIRRLVYWNGKDFLAAFNPTTQSKYLHFNYITEKTKYFNLNKKYQFEKIAGGLMLN